MSLSSVMVPRAAEPEEDHLVGVVLRGHRFDGGGEPLCLQVSLASGCSVMVHWFINPIGVVYAFRRWATSLSGVWEFGSC